MKSVMQSVGPKELWPCLKIYKSREGRIFDNVALFSNAQDAIIIFAAPSSYYRVGDQINSHDLQGYVSFSGSITITEE